MNDDADDMKALLGADALALLANHLTQVNVQLNGRALRALVFLSFYSPRVYAQVFPMLMMLKPHTSSFAAKNAVDAINAISLKDFISTMKMPMGGGGGK